MTETEVTIANGAGLILSLVCSYGTVATHFPGEIDYLSGRTPLLAKAMTGKESALQLPSWIGTGKRLVMLLLAATGIYMNVCLAGASLA